MSVSASDVGKVYFEPFYATCGAAAASSVPSASATAAGVLCVMITKSVHRTGRLPCPNDVRHGGPNW
jgi:hypothetical protein